VGSATGADEDQGREGNEQPLAHKTTNNAPGANIFDLIGKYPRFIFYVNVIQVALNESTK
jgi:hypothetical protein